MDFAGFDVSLDNIRKLRMKFGHMILKKIIKFVATFPFSFSFSFGVDYVQR